MLGEFLKSSVNLGSRIHHQQRGVLSSSSASTRWACPVSACPAPLPKLGCQVRDLMLPPKALSYLPDSSLPRAPHRAGQLARPRSDSHSSRCSCLVIRNLRVAEPVEHNAPLGICRSPISNDCKNPLDFSHSAPESVVGVGVGTVADKEARVCRSR